MILKVLFGLMLSFCFVMVFCNFYFIDPPESYWYEYPKVDMNAGDNIIERIGK